MKRELHVIGPTNRTGDRTALAAPLVETFGMELVTAGELSDAFPALVPFETDVALSSVVLGGMTDRAGVGEQLWQHVHEAYHLGDQCEIGYLVEADVEFPDALTTDADLETVRFFATRLNVVDDGIESLFHIRDTCGKDGFSLYHVA